MASSSVFRGAVACPILVMVLFAGGCSVGPDYKRPSLWSPSAWLSHDTGHVGDRAAPLASVTDPSPPDPRWWSVFHDPELSALEQRAALNNLDVRMATARLAQSRAQLRVTSGDQYPSLTGAGSFNDMKISNKLVQRGLESAAGGLPASGIGGAAAGAAGGAAGGLGGLTANSLGAYAGTASIPPLSLWEDGIDASWELDLWGRVRREVESARASLSASVEDRRAVLIARLAEVARDYMTLRGAQTLRQIALDNQKTAESSLALTRARFAGGLTTELDVQNAAGQLDSISAELPQRQQQVQQQINALGLLLGEPPGALRDELEAPGAVPPVPPVVPVGVPSELARRRPDIREAEARLHAATASVGVAVASFYPRVTLMGSLNFESLELRDLAFWQSAAYSIGPSISLPIFEGGKLRGQLQLNQAQQQEAAISYQQTVLSAWRDVDNALIAFSAEQRRHDQLAQAVQSGQRALHLAQEQYRNGLQTFLDVLDAERQLLSAQQQLAGSATTESQNLVQLYTALGGGWEPTYPETVAKPGAKAAL